MEAHRPAELKVRAVLCERAHASGVPVVKEMWRCESDETCADPPFAPASEEDPPDRDLR